MVDPPVAQPLTAEDYEDRGARAMHAVLIRIRVAAPFHSRTPRYVAPKRAISPKQTP
jgi:hypothetical protein